MSFISLVPAIYFNVKSYGALGDGTTDDTAAILSAIAAAVVNGGTVFFPPGVFYHLTDIALTNINNVSIKGAGRSGILKSGNSTTCNGIAISGCSHISVSDLQINGNKSNMSGGINYKIQQGIFITGSDDVTVERCYIHDCYSSGIMANGNNTNLFIKNNRMVACFDNQIYVRANDLTPYTACSNGTISGNICSGGSYSGIQVLGSSYYTIENNICFNNGPTAGQGDGIGSEGASYITITGNVCYNNGVQGIQSRFTNEVGTAQISSHIIIKGNECYNNTNAGGDNGGIGVNDSDDVLVEGNLVYGNTFGININGGNGNGVTNCKIIGNKVRNNSDSGIRLTPGNASTFILEDNESTDNGGDNLYTNVRIHVNGGVYARAATSKEGIHFASGSDGSTVNNIEAFDGHDNGILIDSPVANIEVRNSTFDNITTTNQARALYESSGAGPTRMVNCRIKNQATAPYFFTHPASYYTDDITPLQGIMRFPSILTYDGSATYATAPDAAALDMTAAVSIELWYNPLPSQNGFATLLGKNSQYYLEGSSTGTDLKWQFFTNVSGSDRGSGLMNTALTPGRLNHLVCTYDSVTHQQKIYVNGVLDYTNTLSGLGSYTIGTSTNLLYIGTRQGFTTTRNAKGQMGEMRIWNAALSATDVANHYNNGLDTTTTTTGVLVARWKSNEGTGTSLVDSAGTNTGTITSATWNYPFTPYNQRPLLATGASHTVDDVITVLQNLGIVRQV